MPARLTVHDVNFAGTNAGVVVSNLDVPSADALREVLVELGRRHPECRLFCRPEIGRHGTGRWVPLPAAERQRLCEAMVAELRPPIDIDALMAQVMSPLPNGLLSRYAVGESTLTVWRDHIVGDGSLTALTPPLLLAAMGRAPLPDLDDRSAVLPLTRALAHHYLRRPRRVVDTLREPRPAAVSQTADALTDHAGSLAVHPRAGTPPEYAAATGTASAEVMAGLVEWRRTFAPQASTSSVLFALIRRAFDDAGVKFASPGLRVLVSARRYLPPGVEVEGNFSAAVYLEPDDPRSPTSVERTVRRNLDSGRPLATMVASAVKNSVRRGDTDRSPGTGSLGTLTVSNLGRLRSIETLPIHDSIEYRAVARPADPDSVTVQLAQVNGRCTVTATFCPATVDRPTMSEVIRRITVDPVALLGDDWFAP